MTGSAEPILNFPSIQETVDKTASESVGNSSAVVLNPGEMAKRITENQRAITNATGTLSEFGAAVGANALDLTKQANAAKQQYQVGLDALMKQIDDTNAIVVDASEKARKGRYIPEAAQMIMSIFGMNDFDPKYQQNRVEEGLRSLDLANRRVNAVGAIAQTKEQMADQAIKGQETVVRARGIEAQATEATTRTLISLKHEEDNQKLVSLSKLTDAQIAAALANPNAAAKLAPGVEKGLIERNAKERQATNTALATASMTLKQMKLSYPYLEHRLASEKTQTDLQTKLMEAKVPADIQKVVLEQVSTALTNMSIPKRSALLKEARENGGYAKLDLGGGQIVPVSDVMISSAEASYNKKTVEEGKALAELDDARIDVYSFLKGKQQQLERLTSAYTGFVPPDQIAQLSAKSDAIAAIGFEGSPRAVFSAQKNAKEVDVEIKKLDDKFKSEFPKQAPAVKEYVYTGGVRDVETASMFLGDRYKTGASQISAGNLFFDSGNALTGFSKYFASQNNVLPGGLGKDEKDDKGGSGILDKLQRTTPKEQQAFETYLNDTQSSHPGVNLGKPVTTGQYITGNISGQIRQTATQAAVLDLAALKPDGGSVPEFSRAIVNGKLDPRYRNNIKGLFADLAASDVMGGTKSLEALSGKINDPEFQRKVVEWYQANIDSPETASIARRFINNDPVSIIVSINRDIAIAKQTAIANKQSADADVESATSMAGMAPSGMGSGSTSPIPPSPNPIISPSLNKPMINLDPIIQMLTPAPGQARQPQNGNMWQASPDLWRQRQ